MIQKITLALIFFALNCITSKAESDSLKLLQNNRSFILSTELIYNNSKSKEELFNEKVLRSGTRVRIMPNQKMALGQHGNFSVFAFGSILYRKIEVEEFQNSGPAIHWTEESPHFESGIGTSFEFFWHSGKIKAGIGFEASADFLKIFDENLPGISVGPFLFFEFKEQYRLEFGDEIEIHRPTLASPTAKISYLF